MKKRNPLFNFTIQIVALLLIVSCKKDKTNEPASVNTLIPVIAPCELEENVFYTTSGIIDSLEYTNDTILSSDPAYNVENCHYYIKKESADSSFFLNLYFMQEPVTGKYLSSNYNNFLEEENRVLLRHNEGGGFVVTSTGNELDTIYVNNEDGVITISFCDLRSHIWGIDQILLKCHARITVEK